MRYTVEISCDDYLEACHFIQKKRRRIELVVFAFFIFIGIMFQIYLQSASVLMASVFFTGTLIVVNRVLQPWLWKRLYKQNKLLGKPIEFEFTEQGLHTYSDNGNGTYQWTDFHKWQESKKLFFVCCTDVQGHIIPKRIFTTAEEEQALRSYLTHALGPAK